MMSLNDKYLYVKRSNLALIEKNNSINKNLISLNDKYLDVKRSNLALIEQNKSLGNRIEKIEQITLAFAAKGVIWKLEMSSKYSGLPNTYEALQTDDITQGRDIK